MDSRDDKQETGGRSDRAPGGDARPDDSALEVNVAPAEESLAASVAPIDASHSVPAASTDADQSASVAPTDAGHTAPAASTDAVQAASAAPTDAGLVASAAPVDASHAAPAASTDAGQSASVAPADAGRTAPGARPIPARPSVPVSFTPSPYQIDDSYHGSPFFNAPMLFLFMIIAAIFAVIVYLTVAKYGVPGLTS